jgi:hypothetical protein
MGRYVLMTKPRVTQAHNIWLMENVVIHVEQSEKAVINIDQAAGYMWMTEFSVTLMWWACVTRGFFEQYNVYCKLRAWQSRNQA